MKYIMISASGTPPCWVKEHNVKRLVSALLAASLLLVNAAAVQETTQMVDSFTGESVSDGSTQTHRAQTAVSDRVLYDRAEDSYVYTTSGGKVYTDVVDGMVTQDVVSIRADDSMSCTLYKDGERQDDADLTAIAGEGSYVLQTANGSSFEPLFSFTILGQTAGESMSGFRVPVGFAVDSITIDGAERFDSNGYIDMSEEGQYEISYECPAAGKFYALSVYIDHTPPTLALEAVQNGVAHGPVDVSDLEEGVSMTVYREGEEISVANEIDRSGSYTIELVDAAGNRTTYEFTIMVYLNISSWAVIILLVLVGLSLMTYLLVSRRRLHVR